MLGNHSNNQILSAFVTKHVERIKKVDIDIFKSGRDKKTIYKYKAIPSQNNTASPVKIQFMGENHLIIRFLVKLKDNEELITAILDKGEEYEKNKLDIHVVKEYGEKYALVGATFNEPEWHSLYVEIQDPFHVKKFDFNFYILARELEKDSEIDIPVVEYQNALLNTTKLWLLSRKYDRVRRPNWAGFFDDRLRRYPMTEEGARKVEEDLMYEARNKIGAAVLSEVHAKPLLEERGWGVSVISTDLSTSISTKNLENSHENHIIVNEKEDIIKQKEI